MSQGAVSKKVMPLQGSQVSDRAVKASVLDPVFQRPCVKNGKRMRESKRVFLYTYEEFFQDVSVREKQKHKGLHS